MPSSTLDHRNGSWLSVVTLALVMGIGFLLAKRCISEDAPDNVTVGRSDQVILLSYVGDSSAVASEATDQDKVKKPKLEFDFHKNKAYGFSIGLPTGWGPVSDSALAAQSSAVSGPNQKINYIAGYQKLANELFVHPYILVRQLPEKIMPKDKIKSARNLFRDSRDEIARLTDENVGHQLNLDLGVPVLEEETGVVWLKFQLDGLDGQRVEGLMAHYYIGDKILQFNAGTTAVRGKSDWPVLERILRSIKTHAQ